jgi:hypothetical protein
VYRWRNLASIWCREILNFFLILGIIGVYPEGVQILHAGISTFQRRFIVFVFNEEKINKVDFAMVEAINKVTQWLMGNIIKKEKWLRILNLTSDTG